MAAGRGRAAPREERAALGKKPVRRPNARRGKASGPAPRPKPAERRLFVGADGKLLVGRVLGAVAAAYAVVHLGTCLAMGSSQERAAASPPASASASASSGARAVAPAAGGFSGDEAYRLVGELVKLQRYYAAPERQRAIDFLVETIEPSVGAVSLQKLEATERVSGKRYELVNIIARQNPAAKARILVGSHWDSRLWAEEDPDPARRGEPLPGANDGGSGVAVLLELARRTKGFSAIGIDYVLFDGEEFGRPGSNDYCQGSEHFARELAQFYPGEKPRAVIAIDMVGDKDQGFYYEASSLSAAPDLVHELWDAAKRLGLSGWHPSPQYHITDDHTPFQRLGIPAMLLIDYDYPYWHTHADTLDKVGPKSLEAVGSALYELLAGREAKGGG